MKKHIVLVLTLLIFQESFSQGCIRITSVDPINDLITITNTTGAVADISDYRMCSLFSYSNDITNGTTIISGNPSNMPDGTAIEIEWPINDNEADVGLYLPSGAFSDASAMVDFMQYGTSGLGRESVADEAGLWTAGTFVENTGAMTWVGSCNDHSAGNWFSTDLQELTEISFSLAPNPVQDELSIYFDQNEMSIADILIYDLNGRTVLNEQFPIINQQLRISTSEWSNGTYILRLNYNNGNFSLRKVLKE